MILKDPDNSFSPLGRITELHFNQNFSHLELNFECTVNDESSFSEFFSHNNLSFIIDDENGMSREINGELLNFEFHYEHNDFVFNDGTRRRISSGRITASIKIFVHHQRMFLNSEPHQVSAELNSLLIEKGWNPLELLEPVIAGVKQPLGIIQKVKTCEVEKQQVIILKRKLTLRKV